MFTTNTASSGITREQAVDQFSSSVSFSCWTHYMCCSSFLRTHSPPVAVLLSAFPNCKSAVSASSKSRGHRPTMRSHAYPLYSPLHETSTAKPQNNHQHIIHARFPRRRRRKTTLPQLLSFHLNHHTLPRQPVFLQQSTPFPPPRPRALRLLVVLLHDKQPSPLFLHEHLVDAQPTKRFWFSLRTTVISLSQVFL